MARLAVSIMLLALGLGLSFVSRAPARIIHDDSPLPRLVATVIALAPRGLATLRSVDGALYQVLTGTGWYGRMCKSCNWIGIACHVVQHPLRRGGAYPRDQVH